MGNGNVSSVLPVVDACGWEPADLVVAVDDQPAVVELARLLPRVAALASRVNSKVCTDRDRERLRELVPGNIYCLLLLNLVALRSRFASAQVSGALRAGRAVSLDLRRLLEEYKMKEV